MKHEFDACAETQHTLSVLHSLGACVALRVLGRVSWLVSELRVASGLATGAVEWSAESLVQRSVNCRVGPWEKLSNGGKRCKNSKHGVSLHRSAVWTEGYLVHAHKHTPFHLGWSPRSPSSYRRDTPPSLAWTPRTRRPITADACTQVHDNVFSLLLHKRCNDTFSFLCQKVLLCVRQCMCVSFTCFYQRLSSELQMWFLPPPWEQSSSFSCSQLLLKSLKKTHGDMNLCSAKPSLVFCTDVELRGWLCLIFKFKQLKKYRYR